MSTRQWMPLYVGDYTRDTMDLNREDHGSYLLLLMHYWSTGRPLPDEDETLATIARCPTESWPRTRRRLERFFTIADGYWRQKRIEKELSRSQAKSDAAAQSAKSRWNGDANAYANAMRTHMPTHSERICDRNATTTTTRDKSTGTSSGKGTGTGQRQPSVWELSKIIEAKEKQSKALFNRYASETASGVVWGSPDKANEYKRLRSEIKRLNGEIAKRA